MNWSRIGLSVAVVLFASLLIAGAAALSLGVPLEDAEPGLIAGVGK